MKKNKIPTSEEKRIIVSDYFNGLKGELETHTDNQYSLLPRKDNGKYDDVESYWLYWGDRRFAKLDVFYEEPAEVAYKNTKDYLNYITDHNYAMTPFIVYITYNKGPEFFLYKRGPEIKRLGYNDFLSLMQTFYWQDKNKEKNKQNAEIKEYIDHVYSIIDSSNLPDSKKESLKSVFSLDTINFSDGTDVVSLSQSAEKDLFLALLADDKETHFDTICRYTSVSSLFRTLNDKKSSMLSIVCMNDVSECSYVSDFLSRRKCDVLENTWKENNRFFIISCADIGQADDLMMWNMYGDHAEGVCIQYSIDRSKIDTSLGFNLARISYGTEKNEHKELELIAALLKDSFKDKRFVLDQLGTWQHFFKSYEYHREKEIRLLLEEDTDNKTKWVFTGDGIITPVKEIPIVQSSDEDSKLFPLTIKKIIIGPKAKNADSLVSQIQAMIQLHESQKETCEVVLSRIDSYR